jgi:hypothetical protein
MGERAKKRNEIKRKGIMTREGEKGWGGKEEEEDRDINA